MSTKNTPLMPNHSGFTVGAAAPQPEPEPEPEPQHGGGLGAAVQEPVRRAGEESSELGEDEAFVFSLRKALRSEPLAKTVLEALRPLLEMAGIEVEMVAAALAGRQPTMRARLRQEGVEDYSIQHALAIYAYTLQNPKIYAVMNGAIHATDRENGKGGISPELRSCIPYMKFLDTALEELPEKYKFKGRVNRGVKWAFPDPESHDPEGAFPVGRTLYWYEFKSSAKSFDVMYHDCFCGESGPRTIFTVDACDGYEIKPFSHFPEEAEVLFRPLSKFQVTSVQKRLMPQHLKRDAPKGGFPDEVHMSQISAKQPGRAVGVVEQMQIDLNTGLLADSPYAQPRRRLFGKKILLGLLSLLVAAIVLLAFVINALTSQTSGGTDSCSGVFCKVNLAICGGRVCAPI